MATDHQMDAKLNEQLALLERNGYSESELETIAKYTFQGSEPSNQDLLDFWISLNNELSSVPADRKQEVKATQIELAGSRNLFTQQTKGFLSVEQLNNILAQVKGGKPEQLQQLQVYTQSLATLSGDAELKSKRIQAMAAMATVPRRPDGSIDVESAMKGQPAGVQQALAELIPKLVQAGAIASPYYSGLEDRIKAWDVYKNDPVHNTKPQGTEPNAQEIQLYRSLAKSTFDVDIARAQAAAASKSVAEQLGLTPEEVVKKSWADLLKLTADAALTKSGAEREALNKAMTDLGAARASMDQSRGTSAEGKAKYESIEIIDKKIADYEKKLANHEDVSDDDVPSAQEYQQSLQIHTGQQNLRQTTVVTDAKAIHDKDLNKIPEDEWTQEEKLQHGNAAQASANALTAAEYADKLKKGTLTAADINTWATAQQNAIGLYISQISLPLIQGLFGPNGLGADFGRQMAGFVKNIMSPNGMLSRMFGGQGLLGNSGAVPGGGNTPPPFAPMSPSDLPPMLNLYTAQLPDAGAAAPVPVAVAANDASANPAPVRARTRARLDMAPPAPADASADARGSAARTPVRGAVPTYTPSMDG